MGGNDNRWRIAAIPLVVALALAGCKKKKEETAYYPVPAGTYPIPAPDATIDAPGDAPSDASLGQLAANELERVHAYIDLLAIDFWLYQLLLAFPGAPPSGTFVANDYRWAVADLQIGPFPIRETVDRIGALAALTPRTPTDDAVRAYTDALAPALPALLDLRAYYQSQHFIDDEFDRARREAPDVDRLRVQLSKLRVPMRAAVLTAWQELSSDVRDSPRAIVTAAWRTCIGVADPLMAGAKRPVIEAAIGACRRSVPTVSALPAQSGGAFANELRKAAIEIGDAIANEYMARDLPGVLAHFTATYLALWPTLANTPAEHAP